jgi:hypothetical protein
VYLGFFVSVEGLKMDPKKVKAIIEWPTPISATKVKKKHLIFLVSWPKQAHMNLKNLTQGVELKGANNGKIITSIPSTVWEKLKFSTWEISPMWLQIHIENLGGLGLAQKVGELISNGYGVVDLIESFPMICYNS